MKSFKVGGIVIASVLLTACAASKQVFRSHADDYQEQAGSVQRVSVPSNSVSPSSNVDYYPITQPNPGPGASVSKIPPGFYPKEVIHEHNAAKQAKKTEAKTAGKAAANQQQFSANTTTLALPMSLAWTKVGEALQSSGYQVLDQDDTVHTYYVLDSTQTGHHITTTTPIEKVVLSANNKTTVNVAVLDQNNKMPDAAVSQSILTAIKTKV